MTLIQEQLNIRHICVILMRISQSRHIYPCLRNENTELRH